MGKDTVYAILIDFLGIILMVISFALGFPLGLIFPLISYFIVYKYFENQFWLAFILSAALLFILVFGGLYLADPNFLDTISREMFRG